MMQKSIKQAWKQATKTWLALSFEILITAICFMLFNLIGLSKDISVILAFIISTISVTISIVTTSKKSQAVAAPSSVIPVTPATSSSTPVLVEVLITIFLGIYGVGWLMAGEKRIGTLLLISSILLYWPILTVGFILTMGTVLIFLGPLVIGAFILNAILLHNKLKQKTARGAIANHSSNS